MYKHMYAYIDIHIHELFSYESNWDITHITCLGALSWSAQGRIEAKWISTMRSIVCY